MFGPHDSLIQRKNTVYRLLDKVSEQTGFLFIYDSKLIDNEKRYASRKETTPSGRQFT